MSKPFYIQKHPVDRAAVIRHVQEENTLQEFLKPKRPRGWADVVKDIGEVCWDAAYEGVAKDVVYEGICKKVIIGAPVAAYRWIRPAKAAATPPDVPAELELPGASGSVGEPAATSMARRRALFVGGALGDSNRTTRPLPWSDSFKKTDDKAADSEPVEGCEAASQMQRRRELYHNLSLRRSNNIRFEATRFTDAEIAEIEESWVPATHKDIARQLFKRSKMASNLPHAVAAVRPGTTRTVVSVGPANAGWRQEIVLPFELASDEPIVAQLVTALLRGEGLPAHIELDESATLALRLRGEDFQTQVADKVMALGKVDQSTRANGESVDIDEQVFFTLFDGLLRRGRDGVGDGAQIDGQALYDFLADGPGAEFRCTNAALAEFLNDKMRSNEPHIRDLRMRLALFEVAKLNYFENAEIKEATKEFLAGTIVGAVGETAIEFIPPVNKNANFDVVTYVLNVVFGGLVDFVDNYKGRMGAVTMGAANADEATLRQQQRAALRASACGAAYGTVANFAAQYPIALKEVSTWWLMAGTWLSIWGSSMSIPFQMQADRTRKAATVVGLLKRDIAKLPPEVLTAALAELHLPAEGELPPQQRLIDELRSRAGHEGDVEQGVDIPWQLSTVVTAWADRQALSDMSMSISSTSSTAGFFVAPCVTALWGFNFIGKGVRTPLQAVIFGVSPGAENLSTGAAAGVVAGRARKQMAGAITSAIAIAAKGEERADLNEVAQAGQAMATLSRLTVGATRVLANVGRANLLRQRSLL